MNTKKNNLLILTHPKLVKSEWDYELNNANNIDVNTVTYGAGVKANWHCNACNSKYVMRVKDKTNGQKYPYCTGKKVLPGFNDLQSLYPDLISKEWDYEKNNANGIHPDELTKGSGLKTWWRCAVCKGSYEMKTYLKTNGNGCPFCAGKRVLVGFNDLLTLYPELIESEWNYAVNDSKNINPSELTKGSHRKASWKCSEC